MDARLERIDYLKKSFDAHPAVELLGAKLEILTMLYDNVSYALVKAVAKPEFLVHTDLKPGLIVQGGLSFSIANFAGVYAAMVHTEKHTPLVSVNQIMFHGKITEGEEMFAHATANRKDDLYIFVTFSILDKDGSRKLSGNAYYRDDRKK
jgi:acyl-coenzyme A thioesterase PaaI-like protein